MELDRPFRGSQAVARGLVSKGRLRGPDVVALGHDVYVAACVPVDQLVRAHAAVMRYSDAVVTGTAAALLLGADEAVGDIGRAAAPTEVLVPRAGVRSRGDVEVRQGEVAPDEVVLRPDGDGPALRLTSPARTIVEVARRLPTVEAVVVADALGRCCGVGAAELVALADRHTGERGMARVRAVAAVTDPRSDTPRRTRVRLGVLLARLPPPEIGLVVRASGTGEALGTLDLGWPATRSGALLDRSDPWDRAGALLSRGWEVVSLGREGQDGVAHVVERVIALVARVDRFLWRDLPDMRGRFPRRPTAPRVYTDPA